MYKKEHNSSNIINYSINYKNKKENNLKYDISKGITNNDFLYQNKYYNPSQIRKNRNLKLNTNSNISKIKRNNKIKVNSIIDNNDLYSRPKMSNKYLNKNNIQKKKKPNIYSKEILISNLINNNNFNSNNSKNDLNLLNKKNYLNSSKLSFIKESCLNDLSKTYIHSKYSNDSINSKDIINKNEINSMFNHYKTISSVKNLKKKEKQNNCLLTESNKNPINIQNYNTYNIINLNTKNSKIDKSKIRNYMIEDGKFSNIYSSSNKYSNTKVEKKSKIKNGFKINLEYIINPKNKNEIYKLIKMMGKGSYSCVYEAKHTKSNTRVAIKFYNKTNNFTKTREKSIKREISILTMVNHKNIIDFYDCFSDDNFIYLITELVDGLNIFEILKDHHKKNKKISVIFIKDLMIQTMNTLEYLHNKDICHRDIKLENIMYDSINNIFKLIDFGFSTRININEKIPIFCGTPSYMSPHLINKLPSLGNKNDVWALGVLFFVLIRGKFPFKAKSTEILKQNINEMNIKSLNKRLNHLWNNIFERDENKRINIKKFKSLFSELFNFN